MGVYKEISRAKILDDRNVVISSYEKGGYTIAQEVMVSDNGKSFPVFLKGAFHVDDITGLKNIKDALIDTIAKIENGMTDSNMIWDDDSLPF